MIEDNNLVEEAGVEEQNPNNNPSPPNWRKKLSKSWSELKWIVKEGYRRFKIWAFNPSRLLRTVLVVFAISFALFVLLEKGIFDAWGLKAYKVGMSKNEWVPATGVFLAASGWIISSIVTIRNSVKQHSINTLLQTRLSGTYMDRAVAVRVVLEGFSPKNPVSAIYLNSVPERSATVDYILNYLEFMAVGIRHGDLHEEVMKDSMRGILLRFTEMTKPYIDNERTNMGPRTFQNMLWLYRRWKD